MLNYQLQLLLMKMVSDLHLTLMREQSADLAPRALLLISTHMYNWQK